MQVAQKHLRGIETKAAILVRNALVIGLIALGHASIAQAQLLEYSPFSGYSIAEGILGNDYQHPLGACITYQETHPPASASDVRVSIVFNADQYRQAFHIDQNAQASYLGIFKGSDELHISQDTLDSGSAYDIIVEAYSQRDGDSIGEHPVHWDPHYQKMMDSGNRAQIEQVRADCGDRYIKTVFYEMRLFAVIHVSNHSSSTLRTLSGQVKGSIDTTVLDAAGDLGGDETVSSAHKDGALNIELHTEGVGFKPTLEAVGIAQVDGDGLQAIADKLSKWVIDDLKDLPKGQPVKYQLAPLPGLRTVALSDERISSVLIKIKSDYNEGKGRLSNVESLLQPTDPRRILLRQPQADDALRQQEAKLTQYVNTVASAHDGCLEARTLNACTTLESKMGSPPRIPSVELVRALPPVMGAAMFAIDGAPVPPGETSRLFPRPGTTLMEEARSIKVGASTVDLLAPIYGDPYLTMLETMAMVAPPARLPFLSTVPKPRVLAQDLSWPRYWRGAKPSAFVLHILHADVQHPCKTVNIGGVGVLDESCLTAQGQILRELALTDLALYVSNEPPAQYSYVPLWFTTDCFGYTGMMPLGQVKIDFAASPSAAQVGISLSTGDPSNLLPVIEEVESHNASDWGLLVQDRLKALAGAGISGTSADSCSPRVP